jgi:hypothetical protein
MEYFLRRKGHFPSNGTGDCRLCLRLKSLISIINALTQTRVYPGILHIPVERRQPSKHIENLYVDRPQFTTHLLPLTSTGFHPDGNSPGKYMENSGKQNPKMGFKSPPRAEALAFKWFILNNLRSKVLEQIQNFYPHRLMPRLKFKTTPRDTL